MDDCLKSVPTNPKAGKLVGELHELLSRGGFRLTKWISNSKKVMDSVPESEKGPSVKNFNLSEKVTLTQRVLRVQYNVHTDRFGYKIVDKKKTLLEEEFCVICSVYDPLGFLTLFFTC